MLFLCCLPEYGGRVGNYRAGFRFGKLSLDLIEKKGFDRFKARVYFGWGCAVIPCGSILDWAFRSSAVAFETALETGDQTYAAYAHTYHVLNGLTSEDPLEEVQREADSAVEFAQHTC